MDCYAVGRFRLELRADGRRGAYARKHETPEPPGTPQRGKRKAPHQKKTHAARTKRPAANKNNGVKPQCRVTPGHAEAANSGHPRTRDNAHTKEAARGGQENRPSEHGRPGGGRPARRTHVGGATERTARLKDDICSDEIALHHDGFPTGMHRVVRCHRSKKSGHEEGTGDKNRSRRFARPLPDGHLHQARPGG